MFFTEEIVMQLAYAVPLRDSENWDLGGCMLDAKRTACGLVKTKPVALESVVAYGGAGLTPNATVTVSMNEMQVSVQKPGKDIFDAILAAVNALVPNNAVVEKVEVHAARPGNSAGVEAIVNVVDGTRRVIGHACEADAITSVTFAYVKALNELYPHQR